MDHFWQVIPQTINDFFDKEIDAINEPNRPIPSGKISIKDVKIQIWVLLIAGLIVAFLLDIYAKHNFPSVLLLALGGSFVSYIYSCLLYTSPSPRDKTVSRMPSSA